MADEGMHNAVDGREMEGLETLPASSISSAGDARPSEMSGPASLWQMTRQNWRELGRPNFLLAQTNSPDGFASHSYYTRRPIFLCT